MLKEKFAKTKDDLAI